MPPRLLSFLTDIEKSIMADEPSPRGGSWVNTRSVSYHFGIARISLACKRDGGSVAPLGEVLLQSFSLADGSICMKATLRHAGSAGPKTLSSFPSSVQSWTAEARKFAATWLADYNSEAPVETANEPMAATA